MHVITFRKRTVKISTDAFKAFLKLYLWTLCISTQGGHDSGQSRKQRERPGE